MSENVAETMPGQSDRAAPLLTAAQLYLNLQRELPQNWGQSKPTGKTHCESIVVRQFACGNDCSLAGDDPALDLTITDNDLEMMREAVRKNLHRMAEIQDGLEMWQGCQNLHATQKESCTQN
jgi:hypothetical protein